MKARILIGALSVLTLGGLVYYPATAQSTYHEVLSGDGASPLSNFLFGTLIAGTYFDNAGFGGTVTLHADGTVVALSGQCCGNAPNVQSESHGNWVRTGPRQIEVTTVAIGTSWDFDLPTGGMLSTKPTGNFIATPSEVLDFAPDFESFTGSLCTALWFYDLGFEMMPDILVEAPDLVVGPFAVEGTRLPVDVVCP